MTAPAASIRPSLAHLILGFIFLALGLFFVCAGFTPTHDVIGGYGPSHFFYDSVARGALPFWNPYAQTGMPFYPSFQNLGLWEPSNYLFILLQKLTGWSTLTTYLFHYLFYYFLFIAGAYNALRIITKNNGVSLLFSLVLLLSVFPVFMHQIGALTPFYLVPFITYFLFKLFEEVDVGKKGFYLFGAVSLCAVSCLNYIPSYMAYYILLFLILAFVFNIATIKDTLRLFKDRRGLFWVGAAAAVAILILAPVAALYYDMKSGNELFPYSRIQISAHHHLPRMLVSDIGSDIFSNAANVPVSITLANMIGLALEPYGIPKSGLQLSEIFLYVGLLPLFCLAFMAFRKTEVRNGRAQLMAAMAALAMLIMANFKACINCPLDAAQKLLVAIVPTLDKIEVFEVFGTVFLFCLIAAASAGFAEAAKGRSRNIWLAAIIFCAAKYASFEYAAAYRWAALSPVEFVERILLFFLCALAILGYFLFVDARLFASAAAVKRLRGIAVALLFSELACFNFVHIQAKDENDRNDGWVLGKQYYAALMRENLLPARQEAGFINYRKPCMENDIYNFTGHEILSRTKVAWPALFNSFFGGRVVVDSDYSTRSYYDYLTNVRLDNQLAASSVIYPILNFYPAGNAVFVPGEREAVSIMNRLGLQGLGKRIVIERAAQHPALPAENPELSDEPLARSRARAAGDRGNSAAGVDLPRLFSPENYLSVGKEEAGRLRHLMGLRFPGYPGFHPRIEYFGPNKLSVFVEAPEDGYFYFGDGYSKHWKAFLDGRPAKIEKTNVNFKSVFMSHGSHHIDFIYDPFYIRHAIYANIVGSLLAILLALFPHRSLFSALLHRKRA